MNFYNDLQDELAAVLNTYFTANSLNFIAVSMSETNKEVQDILDGYREKPVVVVKFNGSNFKDPASINHVSQDEIVTVEFLLVNYLLSGETGSYTQQTELIKCLLGYNPTMCKKRLSLHKIGMVELQNLSNYYAVYMNTERTVVQAKDGVHILGEQFKELSIIDNPNL